MNRYTAFCAQHHSALRLLSVVSALFTMCYVLTGCGLPTWLTDASSIIPVLISSITSIGSFVASLTGNTALAAELAVVTRILDDVEAGLADIETLIAEYKANPSETLLQKIDDVAKLVTNNIQKILTDSGLPSIIASKVQSLARLVLTQLESWLSLLPVLKPAVGVAAHALAGQSVTFTVPLDHATFKAQFNAIYDAPTGDVEIDEALAKARRI